MLKQWIQKITGRAPHHELLEQMQLTIATRSVKYYVVDS
uniref:Uncharacterized protein n=1 Tax=Anguilla anguilla TaxID=7936 RepID=A0A0E9P892_ANGAN